MYLGETPFWSFLLVDGLKQDITYSLCQPNVCLLTKSGCNVFSNNQDLLTNEKFALTWNQISEQLLNLVVANLEKKHFANG